MAARILFDTNVLVYAHDRSEAVKQKQALEVLDRTQEIAIAALTTQVLGEFFWVTTRRLQQPLTLEEATHQVERFARAWPVLDVTTFTVLESLRGAAMYQMTYWDAQIWASARLNQIPVIFSEDFNAGAVLEGVRFENPFSSSFELETWLSG
jgi:predicted nucleic acid-binding protein